MIVDFLVAGSNVNLAYNDAGNQLVISSTDTNTQLTSEQVQDIVGAFIQEGSGVTVVYDDAANTLTINSTGGSGGSGEANTASNSGASGASVFKAKTGVDLAFRKIIGGSNVNVTENTNDITIAVSGGGGDSSGYEYDFAEDSNCKFFFDDKSIDSETDYALCSQITDSSGEGNHFYQATDANKAKFVKGIKRGLNGLQFLSANENYYETANSFAVRHIFILGRYEPIGSTAYFDSYNALLDCSSPNYILVGDSTAKKFRTNEVSGLPVYRLNGIKNMEGNWDAGIAAPTNASGSTSYASAEPRIWLFEIQNSTDWNGIFGIGGQKSGGSLLSGRFWNGIVSRMAMFSSIQTADTLSKIRKDFASRADIHVRLI